jgi:hypothetical protein
MVWQGLAVERMFTFAGRLGLALVLAALFLGGRTAHAQGVPSPYWMPRSPFDFSGNPIGGRSANTYGSFQSFTGTDVPGGSFSQMRYNFSDGWFIAGQSGSMGLSMTGIGQGGAFYSVPSLSYQGTQFGYDFQKAGGLPVSVYAGFDTLKYEAGIGGPLSPFETTSSTLSSYGARAGVAIQPIPNLSLSLGLGYTQLPGR